MRKIFLAIFGWICFLSGLATAEFIIFQLLYPYLIQIIIKDQFGFASGISVIIKISILFFIIFITILASYLFFTKTNRGLRLKNWFLMINKAAFGSKDI
jgi:hypothetical protein